jgi:hypothetical protein
VQERLLAKLGPLELITLFQVSKGTRRAVHNAMKSSAFNINAALATFVSDPREFRSHQAACNALIYSKLARCFFDRTTDCTNLCISCGLANDNGESARAYASFRAYLYQGGYVHKRDADGDDEPWMTKVAASGEVMCIYISDTTTPITEAFSQATTADLNVISSMRSLGSSSLERVVSRHHQCRMSSFRSTRFGPCLPPLLVRCQQSTSHTTLWTAEPSSITQSLSTAILAAKTWRRITTAKPKNSKNISTLLQKSNSRNCRWISDRLHTGFLLRLTGERLSGRCEIGSSLTGGSITMERLCGVWVRSGRASGDGDGEGRRDADR